VGKVLVIDPALPRSRLQNIFRHIFFDIYQNRYMIPLEESTEKHKGIERMAGLLDD
jgi:hypothetical protein